jgi:hypothetical protein
MYIDVFWCTLVYFEVLCIHSCTFKYYNVLFMYINVFWCTLVYFKVLFCLFIFLMCTGIKLTFLLQLLASPRLRWRFV